MRVKVLGCAFLLVGCARTGDDVFPHVEAGTVDALVIMSDARRPDARPDAGIDAAVDATSDAADAAIDATPDADPGP
jgi:hypothetical protein